MKHSCIRPLFVLLVLPLVPLFIVAGCTPRAVTPSPTVTPPIVPPTNVYVGSEACGACHAAEWHAQQKTFHAHTFRPMTISALGALAPRATRFQDTTCGIAIKGDHYVLYNPGTGQTKPLTYALGSGKQGMTFIAIQGADVFEMRKTYSPRASQWYATPGQEQGDHDPNYVGKMWQDDDARACVLCHAVTIPSDRLDPEPKFMGVGCEACHGPGSAHIAAVNAHATDLKMEHLGTWGGKQLDTLCAKCHRSSADVADLPVKQRRTQRFMVYGLELSRCFRESKDRLTCLTCHEPHTDARTDATYYERICLSCHAKSSGTHIATDAATPKTPGFSTTICPINARSGCIACHMPKRSLFTDNGNRIPVTMADHYIRVNRLKDAQP